MTSAEPLANAESLAFPRRGRSWLVWAIGAIFYLTGFYQRVSPAVMTSELMRGFHIGAAQLGNLSAFYFYLYVAMQIPVGALVDSWGARRLLIAGSISAALGTFLFGWTDSFALACAGRAIVGGATAVGWVVLLKLATHWFPSARFAMLSGLGLFMGNIGALAAQVPLRLAIERFGWRGVVIASAAVILAVGGLAWAFVRDDPADIGRRSYAPAILQKTSQRPAGSLFAGFRRVFGYRNTWLIFFANGGMVGPVMTFTGLWGTPFLKARYGVTSATAAAICSLMIVCWAVASPLSGHLSDQIKRRKPIYWGGCCAAALGWLTLFRLPSLPLSAFTAVAALTAFACGVVVIGFAFSKESVPVRYLGTISGTTNIGNMIGPMLLQPGIGLLLDRNWTGQSIDGHRIYGPLAFEQAFLLIVGWSILSAVLLGFTRETSCRQNSDPGL